MKPAGRRGVAVISDIGWFLLFLFVALILSWFFFAKFKTEVSVNRVQVENITNDASFIALTLAQTSTGSGKTLGDLARDLVEIDATDGTAAMQASPQLTAYEQALDGIFTDQAFWTPAESKQGDIDRKWRFILVVVEAPRGALESTCVGYEDGMRNNYECTNYQLNPPGLEQTIQRSAGPVFSGSAALPTGAGSAKLTVFIGEERQ